MDIQVTTSIPKKTISSKMPSIKKPLPQAKAKLPEYLTIKLTKRTISSLPVNQQIVANHVMILRKDPENRGSLRFLRYWHKKMSDSIEKEELGKLLTLKH